MASKINVFLDSNSIFSDPLFKSSFGKLLLQLSENGKIEIYLSRVVYEESANNYKKNILKNIDALSQIERDFNNILNKPPKLPSLKVNQFTKQFTNFYEKKFRNKTFTIIEFEDGYLEELIMRSIKRIPPFSENRQEFRDAVIWISYVNHIERNKLSNNFFITNNKKDFWNSDKTDLHPDLRNEVNDLKIYSSLAEFCSREKALLKIRGEKEFADWIEKHPLDKDKVLTMLLSQLWHPIKNEISNSVDKINPSMYFGNDNHTYFEYQYNKTDAVVDNFDIKQITDFALVRCTLILKGIGIFYTKDFLWKRDKKEIEIILNLSFNLSKDLILTELKIENVKMNYAQ